MKTISIFIVYLFIFCQCSNNHKSQTTSSILHIPIEEEFQSIPADSLFQSATYIPLETTESSLVTNIDKMLIQDSIFYILDKQQKIILSFYPNGVYKSKLDNIGRGPGEYLSLDDFFITDSLIYTLISDQRKINIYDLNFKFISNFPIHSHGTTITCNNDTLFLFSNYSSLERYHFYMYQQTTGKLIGKFRTFPSKLQGTGYAQTTFAKHKNNMYYFLPFHYTIYTFQSQTTPVYKLDFGEKYMYPQDFKLYSDTERIDYLKRYSDPMDYPIGRINNLFISEQLIFFTFVKGIFPYSYFKWINSNSAYTGSIINSKRFPLINSNVIYIDDNYYISYCQAENLFLLDKIYLPTSLYK